MGLIEDGPLAEGLKFFGRGLGDGERAVVVDEENLVIADEVGAQAEALIAAVPELFAGGDIEADELAAGDHAVDKALVIDGGLLFGTEGFGGKDRKSTRLNSSHANPVCPVLV